MRGSYFSELLWFVAVADHGGFTKASKHLGVSIATLSRAIGALEEQLGVRLFNRTTRSVALTEAGTRLLGGVRAALGELDAAVESVNVLRDRPAGHLRLTLAPWAASFVVAPLLGRFLREYPEISVEVSVDATLTDIVAGRYDAGMRSGRTLEGDMIAVRVSEGVARMAAASPSYLATHGEPATPHDLAGHNCIRYRYPNGMIWPWEFEIDGKKKRIEVEGSFVVNDVDLGLQAALDSVGIVYCSQDHIAPLVASGRLKPVLERYPASHSEAYYLYYPKNRRNPTALQALIKFLRANLS